MNENFTFDVASGSYRQQTPFQSYQSQMQMMHLQNSMQQSQATFFTEQQNLNEDQSNFELMKIHSANNNTGNFTNGHLQDNLQAVSSPSVSSTADLNGGMSMGQNGIKYGACGGFAPQMDPSTFNMQQQSGSDCAGAQQAAMMMMMRQQQQHFGAVNGQMPNGQCPGGVRFPPLQRRTFLFNTEMANSAAKFMQQQMVEDMASWHCKYSSLVPSTSRASFEQQPTMANNTQQSPAPPTSRGVKRKASVHNTSSMDLQQPHSLSLSPHDIRPSGTPIGHPQSAPVVGNPFDQQHNAQNELCDSSTNGEDPFKQHAANQQMQPLGSIPNYLQSTSLGQIEENPLRKMEMMTSKTLNEPSRNRIFQTNTEANSQQQQQSYGTADIVKLEKMRRLQEIEKTLAPFDTSPSYPNTSPFPDPNQFRPPFFAPPGQMIRAPQFAPLRPPMIGSFPPQGPPLMPMMNPNQQMYSPMGDQPELMQNGIMVPSADRTSQQWLSQS